MKEGLLQRSKGAVRQSVHQFLDARRPDIALRDAADIKFGELYDRAGITTYVFDRDGTLTDYKSSTVRPDIAQNIQEGRAELRQRGVELDIYLATQTLIADASSYVSLNKVALETDARAAEVPASPLDRKPSQRMILKILSRAHAHRGTVPSQVAVVGDKLTADVLSARNAGVLSIAVDHKRVGDGDHVGDKWFRRPYENVVRWLSGIPSPEIMYPEPSNAAKRLIEEHTNGFVPQAGIQATDSGYPDWLPEDLQPTWKVSRIAGYGMDPVELPQEVIDEIPPSLFAAAVTRVRRAMDSVDPRITKKVDAVVSAGKQFAWEHGGQGADLMGDYRKYIAGPVTAIAILLNRNGLAVGSALSAVLADIADGPLARWSKRGATAAGGKKDNESDKAFSYATKPALILTGRQDPLQAERIISSDLEMTNEVRPAMAEEGIDSPATEPSKEAAGADILSDIFSMTRFADRHPIMRWGVKQIVVNMKERRIEKSIAIWRQRHKEFVVGKELLLKEAEAA